MESMGSGWSLMVNLAAVTTVDRSSLCATADGVSRPQTMAHVSARPPHQPFHEWAALQIQPLCQEHDEEVSKMFAQAVSILLWTCDQIRGWYFSTTQED